MEITTSAQKRLLLPACPFQRIIGSHFDEFFLRRAQLHTRRPGKYMTRCVCSTGPGGSGCPAPPRTKLLSPCQRKPRWLAEVPISKRPSHRVGGCSIPSMALILLSGCHCSTCWGICVHAGMSAGATRLPPRVRSKDHGCKV